ncbi:hypothetical protein KYC5002_17325 [Archangium violaceum]|uniref:hypothetical protein n=1 Tax=Archangium violaceum TaxID=83451 RepID=UPI002B2B3160|nr:hypothetical protein KYC5002_17325 [Archangium gephyra]
MMKFFKSRTLAARLRMSSMITCLSVLTGVTTGLTVQAQAQAQDTQARLVITNVEVDYVQGQLFIYGRNFNTPTGAPPVVHLMEIEVNVKIYGPSTVVVALPPTLQRAGSYLLTMSTGPNVEQNDSFDVTLGTQGPKGDKGDKGDTGPKGDKGDTGPKGDKGDIGPQGLKGDKGDTGPKGDRGDIGPQGLKGDRGDIGPQGLKGDRGETGSQGPPGPGAAVIVKNISVLTALHPNCTPSTINQTMYCNTAVHRYCARNGYKTGFGPLEYSGTWDIAFSCVK